MLPGKFITFEGGEGLGKTTNLPFVQDYLQRRNIQVISTREPGGTPLAEKIRQLLLNTEGETLSEHTELLLMFAARSQHITHVINPALAKGCWVLCDRFTDATYAYQGGGRGINTETIAWLEHWVQAGLRPDLTLLFDAPIEIGMTRAAQRGGKVDRFEAEKLSFFEQVRQAYLTRAQQDPKRIKIINAQQSLVDVQQALSTKIDELLST
uniref:dTMP kinase n=1 Tax=Crenothrix polyspora TaxID=360316 RepID=UPI000B363551|nr:dTMP kinase [Crenothrix polyspora]